MKSSEWSRLSGLKEKMVKDQMEAARVEKLGEGV